MENIWWWLPTKSDQAKYRKEELDSIKRKYGEVLSRLAMFSEEMGNAENKLVATFSKEQHELWFNLKVLLEKAHFQSIRKNHFDERLKEIPQEINELLTFFN